MRKQSSIKSPAHLCRSESERIIGGVAGGLADFLNIDPTLVRLVFILFTVFGGSGVLLYLVLWLIIPRESLANTSSHSAIKENVEEIKIKTKKIADDLKARGEIQPRTLRVWIGLAILFLGVSLLLENFGFHVFRLVRLWPLILIVIAWSMLSRN